MSAGALSQRRGAAASLGASDAGLDYTSLDGQRVRVEILNEVVRIGARLRGLEEPIVQAKLDRNSVVGGYPLDCPADLASVRRFTAAGGGIVGAAELRDLSRIVSDDLVAPEVIGVAEPYLAARRQPLKA